MKDRWWNYNDIKNAINKPYKKWETIDNTWWKSDPSTAYFINENQYLIKNNKTWDIIQISDKTKKDWSVDSRIKKIKKKKWKKK